MADASESPADGPVGYVMSRFPKLTETFILYEILALQRQGVAVEVYPLHRERCKVTHPEAAAVVARAHFSSLASPALWWSNLLWLLSRPRAYLGAWATCLRATWGSSRYFRGALAAVPLAAHIARQMQRDGVVRVHAHFASHPAAAALVIRRLTGLPYSFTAHGSDLHRERRMLREKMDECDFAVAISQFNKDWIERECGADAGAKVSVVHCGVSPADFAVERDYDRAGPLRIVCIGSLHEVKGQSHLIRACSRLQRDGIDFQLHLIGDGPDREALVALAAAERIAERTTLHGAVPRPRVIEQLASADVAVSPSVLSSDGRREGIPVVLMEALASGLPVVASRISGIPELVRDDLTGLLAEPGDADGLAQCLARLGADPALRRRLGEAGRAYVRSDFDLDREARRLADLFRDPRGCEPTGSPDSRPRPLAAVGEAAGRAEAAVEGRS